MVVIASLSLPLRTAQLRSPTKNLMLGPVGMLKTSRAQLEGEGQNLARRSLCLQGEEEAQT